MGVQPYIKGAYCSQCVKDEKCDQNLCQGKNSCLHVYIISNNHLLFEPQEEKTAPTLGRKVAIWAAASFLLGAWYTTCM